MKVKENDVVVSKDTGEIEFNIKAIMILDPENIWESNPVLKFLKRFKINEFYENVIIKNHIDTHIKILWEHMFILDGQVKKFLGMPSFS